MARGGRVGKGYWRGAAVWNGTENIGGGSGGDARRETIVEKWERRYWRREVKAHDKDVGTTNEMLGD